MTLTRNTPTGDHKLSLQKRAIDKANATCFSNGKLTYWLTDTNKLPDCIYIFTAANYMDIINISDFQSLTFNSQRMIHKLQPKLTSKRTNSEVFHEDYKLN